MEINEDECKAKAKELGEGVTFVSAKEVTKDDGSKGKQVTYAFKDVSKIKVSPDSDVGDSMGGGMGGGMGPEEKEVEKAPIKFCYAKGKLTINMPKQGEEKAEAGATPDSSPSPAMTPEEKQQMQMQLQMMKPMFDGMRIAVKVEVDGKIKDTNASHVADDKVITLFNMDFGKIMNNAEAFEKLAAMGNEQDVTKVGEQLKDFEGIQVETEETVNVSF
jgi:hypothetical protein